MAKGEYEVYDISVGISNNTVTWTGDPLPDIEMVKRLSKGDAANVSRICIGAHTATHIDAPLHFFDRGATVDSIPLERLIGPARVADMTDCKTIGLSEIGGIDLAGIERVLFKTTNSSLWGDSTFHRDFRHLEADAAAYLVKSGVKLVGVDYLSVEAPGTKDHPVHKTLLGAGVAIIEGCNLADVPAGDYELICLPLKLIGTEAAPVRAILRRPMR